MALVEGTNAGFVTEAPVADPGAATWGVSNMANASKHTSPVGAIRVTEIGWWCDNATPNVNFEVGIYNHTEPTNRPNVLLAGASRTNAKGTTAGWKSVAVDITITGNTIYWLSVQCDTTSPATETNYGALTGGKVDRKLPAATLPTPWGTSTFESPGIMVAIYAVVEVEVGTNMKVNIADEFKDIDEIKINVGDVWKAVTEAKINIGDVWKTIFSI